MRDAQLDNKELFRLVLPNLTAEDRDILRDSKTKKEFKFNAIRVLIKQRKSEFFPLWRAFEVLDLDHHRSLRNIAKGPDANKLKAIRQFNSDERARDYESTKQVMVDCLRWFSDVGVSECGKLAEAIELGRPIADIEERVVSAFYAIEQRIVELAAANCPTVAEHDTLPTSQTEENMKLKEFFETVLAGFNAAFSIVHRQDNLTRAEILNALKKLDAAKKVEDPGHVWYQWPDDPQTFGGYMRSGPNALGLAQYFTESIWARIQFVKVQEFGMPNLFEMSEEKLRYLIAETIKSLDGAVIDFSNWTGVKRFQDADLLRNKIAVEIKQYMASLTEGDMRRLCEGFDNPILSVPPKADLQVATEEKKPEQPQSIEDAVRQLFAEVEPRLKKMNRRRDRRDAYDAVRNGFGLPDLGFYRCQDTWVAYRKTGVTRHAPRDWFSIDASDIGKVQSFFSKNP